jgi:hypothetical protein
MLAWPRQELRHPNAMRAAVSKGVNGGNASCLDDRG